jgi:hypothetical protein
MFHATFCITYGTNYMSLQRCTTMHPSRNAVWTDMCSRDCLIFFDRGLCQESRLCQTSEIANVRTQIQSSHGRRNEDETGRGLSSSESSHTVRNGGVTRGVSRRGIGPISDFVEVVLFAAPYVLPPLPPDSWFRRTSEFLEHGVSRRARVMPLVG